MSFNVKCGNFLFGLCTLVFCSLIVCVTTGCDGGQKSETKDAEASQKSEVRERHTQKEIISRFVTELKQCQANLKCPKDANRQKIIELGDQIHDVVESMYNVILRYDLPADVRDVALDFARSLSDLSKVFRGMPYIPEGAGEGFVWGLLNGLAGDPTGGVGTIERWKDAVGENMNKVQSKEEDLKIVLIKYGVKY